MLFLPLLFLPPQRAAAQFSAAYELIKAVKDGDYVKAREEMLKCNCPTARDADGDPLLVLAARNGDLVMTHFLLESGANPNAATRSSGETALMVFARADNTEGIALLAAHGADPGRAGAAGCRRRSLGRGLSGADRGRHRPPDAPAQLRRGARARAVAPACACAGAGRMIW